MKTFVVVNRCYGGFGLSDEALLMMEELGSLWNEYNIRNIPRHDKNLVEVVRRLGVKAASPYAELHLVEVPEGTVYQIDEYDGMERIRFSPEWVSAMNEVTEPKKENR